MVPSQIRQMVEVFQMEQMPTPPMSKARLKTLVATTARCGKTQPLRVQTEGISTRTGVGGRRGRKRRRAEVKAWWRTTKAALLKMAART